MAVNFSGTWKQTKTENLDEYLKAMGVGMIKRTAASAATPTVVIDHNGDAFKMKTTTTFKTSETSFKVGQEFEADTQGLGDGTYACVPTFDGKKLTITMTPKTTKLNGGVQDRELISENELLQTMTIGTAVCKRHFKKQ